MALRRTPQPPVLSQPEQAGERVSAINGNGHPPAPARTTRLTVSLPTELLDRLRDAVYWTPQLTLAQLVEESLRAGLAHLESMNRSPFPPRAQELRPGRPPAHRKADHRSVLLLSESKSRPQADPVPVHPLTNQLRDEMAYECRSTA